MIKPTLFLYFVILFCYLLFSRTPDYFEGEFIRGVVIEKHPFDKWIEYRVGKETLVTPIKGWGSSQVAAKDTVTVIYNPDVPTEASHYSFFSYWFTLPELLTSAIAFILLFVAAVFITGKEDTGILNNEDKPRTRRYND